MNERYVAVFICVSVFSFFIMALPPPLHWGAVIIGEMFILIELLFMADENYPGNFDDGWDK